MTVYEYLELNHSSGDYLPKVYAELFFQAGSHEISCHWGKKIAHPTIYNPTPTYIHCLSQHGTDPLFLPLLSVGYNHEILSAHPTLFSLGFHPHIIATMANEMSWEIEPEVLQPPVGGV